MASKTTTTKTTPATDEKPTVDLHAMLVTALATREIVPELRWSPKGDYASYRVEGKTIGYVTKQGRNGVHVKAGVEIDELPKAQRESWESNVKDSPVFAARGVFADAKGIEKVATALALAAAKQAKAREAKAAASTTPVESTEPVASSEPVEEGASA